MREENLQIKNWRARLKDIILFAIEKLKMIWEIRKSPTFSNIRTKNFPGYCGMLSLLFQKSQEEGSKRVQNRFAAANVCWT